VEKLFIITKELVEKVVKGAHDPVLVKTEKSTDVFPIKLGNIETMNYIKVASFMEGLDTLFTENLLEQGKSSQADTVLQKIEEFEHKLEEQIKAISTVKEKAGYISNIAKSLLDLISDGQTSVESIKVIETLRNQNAVFVKERGISFIDINGERIQINPDSSLQAIASTLFNESKRQANAVNDIEIAKRETEKSLERFRKQESIAKDSVVFTVQKKREWYERYRWFFTSDGLLAIGGRDASSNSSVIRKYLENDDKVFHAEIFGSPFFLLKKSSESNMNSILETAQATVCFSRAWREGLYGLSSYWVNPDQVKTAAPSGQFIAKGSFIVEGKRNFVQVSSMRVAIGLLEKNESYSLMCGPPEPVKKNCIYYVIIEPSGFEMVEIAKKIKLEFLKFKEKENVIKSISMDDFTRVIPAGESHIVESGVGLAYK
jgi:predicted ribosome quality control (RQC) complex YloA/Tae2 family protein